MKTIHPPTMQLAIALKLLGLVMVWVLTGPAVHAAEPSHWICDGDPLTLTLTSGGVDLQGLPATVPNLEAGTAPGDGVVIAWRGQVLQLPRTNNAGAPSYTDGRWWWRALDPAHPEWKQRRGEIIGYACTTATATP